MDTHATDHGSDTKARPLLVVQGQEKCCINQGQENIDGSPLFPPNTRRHKFHPRIPFSDTIFKVHFMIMELLIIIPIMCGQHPKHKTLNFNPTSPKGQVTGE